MVCVFTVSQPNGVMSTSIRHGISGFRWTRINMFRGQNCTGIDQRFYSQLSSARVCFSPLLRSRQCAVFNQEVVIWLLISARKHTLRLLGVALLMSTQNICLHGEIIHLLTNPTYLEVWSYQDLAFQCLNPNLFLTACYSYLTILCQGYWALQLQWYTQEQSQSDGLNQHIHTFRSSILI